MLSKSTEPFRRPHADELARRLTEPRRFIQMVTGARSAPLLVQQGLTESPTSTATASDGSRYGDW